MLSISISVSVLILSLSIGYYFAIFLPKVNIQKNNQEMIAKELKNNIDCQNAGMKLYNDDIKSDTADIFYTPNFKFSTKLNTCFYKGGFMSTDGQATAGFIKNVYTNQEIVGYTTIRDKNGETKELIAGGQVSMKDFQKKSEEIFGE